MERRRAGLRATKSCPTLFHLEIAMGRAIAHIAHAAPRHFRVCLDEIDVTIHRLRSSLANDDEAHDDGLLSALVPQEVILGQALYKTARIGCGLLYVINVMK